MNLCYIQSVPASQLQVQNKGEKVAKSGGKFQHTNISSKENTLVHCKVQSSSKAVFVNQAAQTVRGYFHMQEDNYCNC